MEPNWVDFVRGHLMIWAMAGLVVWIGIDLIMRIPGPGGRDNERS